MEQKVSWHSFFSETSCICCFITRFKYDVPLQFQKICSRVEIGAVENISNDFVVFSLRMRRNGGISDQLRYIF